MNEIIDISRIMNQNHILDKNIEMDIFQNKENLVKILTNIIKKGVDYGTKALNFNESNQGIVQSVRELLKGKDLKKIVESSVNVSVQQGIENQKLDINELKQLGAFKELSLKGGLRFLLSAGVDVMFSKISKLNLFKPLIEKLVHNVKNFIMSNSFIQKLNTGIQKLIDKTKDFKAICQKWYDAYNEFDIAKLTQLASELETKKEKLAIDGDCMRQNNTIQNMTKLINNKKEKLSQLQLQICKNL